MLAAPYERCGFHSSGSFSCNVTHFAQGVGGRSLCHLEAEPLGAGANAVLAAAVAVSDEPPSPPTAAAVEQWQANGEAKSKFLNR